MPLAAGRQTLAARGERDPTTSQLTVTSDPLPTIVQGIPLQVRSLKIVIDRPQFIFNATNCAPQAIEATVGSTQSAVAKVSYPYEAANCRTLLFTPSFQAASQARTTRQTGASLHVRIAYAPGQENIHSVAVTLPKQLPPG
jgi:hypothetical protein